MWSGRVHQICVSPGAGTEMQTISEARAMPGKGLAGDRYGEITGTYSTKPGPDREITLIEREAIEALSRESGITLAPKDARRNLVTAGVPLNHLVNREFTVGEVKLRGIRLCEPCNHLEGLTQQGVLRGLIHRGGLRAQILTDGVIRVGDTIQEV
ncbi:MAG: MOSC domain-containing protein [candidate division Zixibacteria bacterium]|nr:MOSC domain-containing protein [candidate division Zixibacteria bacterium]